MKKIEFVSNPNMNPLQSNDSRPQVRYEDLVFKSPYRQRIAKFTGPSTWIRVIPAVAGTAYSWMMRLRVLEFPGGRFVHPRTFDRRANCPYDRAYQWMAAHHPDKLYARANPSGIRLLARDMGLAWIVIEENGKPTLKLVLASTFAGGEDGNAGLGYLLRSTAEQYNENKEITINAVDPKTGHRLCVEKLRPANSDRPRFTVQVGRPTAPIDPLIEAMSEADRDALVRLEDVVERLPEHKQWEYLEKTLGPDLFQEFRTAQAALA